MKKIDLSNRRVVESSKRFEHEWEVLADEMTDYFKFNCYWLFYKFEKWKIFNAFKACKARGNKGHAYLLGILNKV